MSSDRFKESGLKYTGFEKIVLLDEYQEEIDAPQVIKTPLGNYLVVYDKYDTVLLEIEAFKLWSARRGAVQFAALDEDVEEMNDPFFQLRLASEVPVGTSLTIDTAMGVPPTARTGPIYKTPEEFMSDVEVKRDFITCPFNASVFTVIHDEHKGAAQLLSAAKQADKLPLIHTLSSLLSVSRLHDGVCCTNSDHMHLSSKEDTFYETQTGIFDFACSDIWSPSLAVVRYPDKPKTPCVYMGFPISSWIDGKHFMKVFNHQVDWGALYYAPKVRPRMRPPDTEVLIRCGISQENILDTRREYRVEVERRHYAFEATRVLQGAIDFSIATGSETPKQ